MLRLYVQIAVSIQLLSLVFHPETHVGNRQIYVVEPHSAHNWLRANLKRRLENDNLRQWSATVILRLRHAWGVLALSQKPADLVAGQSCWQLLPGSCNADLYYLLSSQS